MNTMSVKVGILDEFFKCGPYHALNHGRCTMVLLPYNGLEDHGFDFISSHTLDVWDSQSLPQLGGSSLVDSEEWMGQLRPNLNPNDQL